MMDEICLKGMAFYGYHGDESAETELGQRFYVDVVLYLDLSIVGTTDCLEDSVNYVEIYNIVKGIAEGEPCKLLERVAGKINEAVMERFSTIQEIRTTIHKPGAPIPAILEDVSVTLSKTR